MSLALSVREGRREAMAKLNQAPCPQCLAAGMAAAWPSPALRLIRTPTPPHSTALSLSSDPCSLIEILLGSWQIQNQANKTDNRSMDGEERKRQAWMEKPALQIHKRHQYVGRGAGGGAHRRPPLEKWPGLLVCVPSARRLLSRRRVLLNQIFNSKNTISFTLTAHRVISHIFLFFLCSAS